MQSHTSDTLGQYQVYLMSFSFSLSLFFIDAKLVGVVVRLGTGPIDSFILMFRLELMELARKT